MQRAAQTLAAAGIDDARRLARRLVAAALDLTPTEIFAHPERSLSEGAQRRVASMLQRMTAREPLSRIIGRREFWGLEFTLSAETLDPRPESETVIEAVCARLPQRSRPYRFLDLGTGTGCLLLALLHEYPRAYGFGIDAAAGAAVTARGNAHRLGFGGRAGFVAGDWTAPIANSFDAVVANPPYIERPALATLPPEVRDYDPVLALDGGADGLAAYRAIAREIIRLLPSGGIFATEIGFGQADAVAAMLTGTGLAIDGFVPDLAGITRCVVARKPGSR
jgi:release factor glutamine methyltransferase